MRQTRSAMAANRTESGGRGYYVYGIVGGSPDLGDLRGVDGASAVFTVAGPGLQAVVSEVPLTEFGEEALRQRLEELPWLEEKVRAHEDVLERAARDSAILPFRFGTIYRSLDSVRELLQARHDALSAALTELEGKREWGVKGILDRKRLRAALDDGERAEPNDKLDGKAFFDRKRAERDLEEQARARAGRLAADAHLRLAAVADQAARDGQSLLKASYLVDLRREDAFRAALDEVAAASARYGFRLELSGPWPPYSFVGSLTP